MLNYITKLENNKLIKLIDWFSSSYIFVVILGLATLASQILGYEIQYFYFLAIFVGLIPALFSKEMKPVIPAFFFAYCSISSKNFNLETGVNFTTDPMFKTHVIILSVIAGVPILVRLVVEIIRNGKNKKFPRLLIGLLLLLVAFSLSGLNTLYFGKTNSVQGAIIILCYLVPYLFIFYTFDFKKTTTDYLMFSLSVFGLVLVSELLFIYKEIGIEVVISNTFRRGLIETGWGCYNNFGCELAISLVGPCYLAYKRKWGAIYTVIGFIIFIGLLLTQSRGAILFGVPLYIVSEFSSIIFSKKYFKIVNTITLALCICFTGYFIYKHEEEVMNVFRTFLESFLRDDLDSISSSRIALFKEGIKAFKENMIFGNGFYKLEIDGVSESGYLLPFRYHNTIIQILASTGLVGIVAYLVHRIETVILVCKNSNIDKLFIFLGMFGFLLTSLLDVHFFNIGPEFGYAVLLVFLERSSSNIKTTVITE